MQKSEVIPFPTSLFGMIEKNMPNRKEEDAVLLAYFIYYTYSSFGVVYDGDVCSHLFGIMEFLRFFVISGECPSNCFGYLILGSLYCRMKSSYKVTFLRSLNNYFPNTVCFMYE